MKPPGITAKQPRITVISDRITVIPDRITVIPLAAAAVLGALDLPRPSRR